MGLGCLEARMSESAEGRWAVWLHPPEGADSELIQAFAEVMAPAANWPAARLHAALLQGPCEITRAPTMSEAEQWVTVLESLGGVAEVSLYTPHRPPVLQDLPSAATPRPSRRSLNMLGNDPMAPLNTSPITPLRPPAPRPKTGKQRPTTLDFDPLPLTAALEDPLAQIERSLIDLPHEPAIEAPVLTPKIQRAPKVERSRTHVGPAPSPPPQRQPTAAQRPIERASVNMRPSDGVRANRGGRGPSRWMWLAAPMMSASVVFFVWGWKMWQDQRTLSPLPTQYVAIGPEDVEPPPMSPIGAGAPQAAKAAPEGAPDDINALFAEGKAACEQAQYTACRRRMKQVIQAQPDHREAYQLMVLAVGADQQSPLSPLAADQAMKGGDPAAVIPEVPALTPVSARPTPQPAHPQPAAARSLGSAPSTRQAPAAPLPEGAHPRSEDG